SLAPAPVAPHSVAPAPLAPAPVAPHSVAPAPLVPAPVAPRSVAPAPGATPAVFAPSVAEPTAGPRADVEPNLPSQIIFKREQDRSATLPVTYREYVYLVPPGTPEAAASNLLHAQLDLVRTSLDRL